MTERERDVAGRIASGATNRRLADEQADILCIPAAFTLYTGKDHWELLLRARAVENQCFVAAATQIGFTPAYIAQASGKTISDANDAESKGWELELQFNPTKYWTLKATGNQQVAIDSNISVFMTEYIAQRLPILMPSR